MGTIKGYKKILAGLVICGSLLLSCKYIFILVHPIFEDTSTYDLDMGSNPASVFYSTYFISESEGWAAGDCGIYHYQDGTWTLSLKSSFVFFYSIFFISPDEGWAVGGRFNDNSGVIFHYKDGVWKFVTPPIYDAESGWELRSVYFSSGSEGWAVGAVSKDYPNNTGLIFHYQNESWESITPPDVSANWELNSVYFTSASEGWAVGRDSTNHASVILHYQDGVWTNEAPAGDYNLRSVHFTSPTEGWAVGNVILHYQDGTWADYTPGVSYNLNSVNFISSSEGWAVGEGMIFHYKDGIWNDETQPEPKGWTGLNGVYFTSAADGWAVGNESWDASALIHYTDGAWVEVEPPQVEKYWVILSSHFTSTSEGWAVGYKMDTGHWGEGGPDDIESGVILHYADGYWSNVDPPVIDSDEWVLWSVDFTSPNEGWAVGRARDGYHGGFYGLIFHYQSGTWTNVPPPVISGGWDLYSVQFTSPDEGWAVGDGAFPLLHYESGSWNPVSFPTSDVIILQSVYFTSASEGWAVGTNWTQYSGVILHYQDGNWAVADLPQGSDVYWLRSLYFVSPDEGWAVGLSADAASRILHYLDGTWSYVFPPDINSDGWRLDSVYFTSADNGWAVGWDYANSKGLILQYGNGEWTQFPEDLVFEHRTVWNLFGVNCYDENNCWMVGGGDGDGLVLKY